MGSSSGSQVRGLRGVEELQAASALYRKVFGFTDADHGVNPRLLRSLQSNGGSVLGAFDDVGALIAFAYGFQGASGGQSYHYSQAAVIAPQYQGRGLGRKLKLAQREAALASGAATMRWTYDPAMVRNAHFNLDVLGARGRWFERSFYGEPGSDRITVEWELERVSARSGAPGGEGASPLISEPVVSEPVVSGPSGHAGAAAPAATGPEHWCEASEDEAEVWLHLPADFAVLQQSSPGAAEAVRARLADALEELIGRGLAAVSCIRLSTEDAAYRLAPVEALLPEHGR